MNSPITIDASVFVSAFTPTEPAHQASKTFMLNMREQSVPIIVPVLVLPEISAALSRGQVKPELGKSFVGGSALWNGVDHIRQRATGEITQGFICSFAINDTPTDKVCQNQTVLLWMLIVYNAESVKSSRWRQPPSSTL